MKDTHLNRMEIDLKTIMRKLLMKDVRLIVEIILEKLTYGYDRDDVLKEYQFIARDYIKT